MSTGLFLWLLTVAGTTCSALAADQQGRVPPEVWEKAQTKGVVRVIVQ